MTARRDREALVEAAAGAHRARRAGGGVATSPAWHDLDAEGREEVYRTTVLSRRLEAALDPEGLSSTARAVLRRIRGG